MLPLRGRSPLPMLWGRHMSRRPRLFSWYRLIPLIVVAVFGVASALFSFAPSLIFGALYPLVRPLLRFVRTATLGQCASVLRPLGFLKGVPESCVRECQSVRLLPLVHRIFLNLFDGAEHPFLRGGAQYRLVMAFMASLEKRVPALCGLTDAADLLLCGGRWPADSGDIT